MQTRSMAKQDENLPLTNPPSFYAPLLWPFSYVIEAIRSPDKIIVPKLVSLSSLPLFETLFSFTASLRSFLLAYTIVYVLHDENNPYPAWGRGKKLSFQKDTKCNIFDVFRLYKLVWQHLQYLLYVLARVLGFDWIIPMLLRNVLACWAICGFWDWFLYLSPWQKKLHKFKVHDHAYWSSHGNLQIKIKWLA